MPRANLDYLLRRVTNARAALRVLPKDAPAAERAAAMRAESDATYAYAFAVREQINENKLRGLN